MDRGDIEERRKRAKEIIRTLKNFFPHAKTALNYTNTWELLVAVMLSARCTDKKVNEVTKALFQKYRALDDYVNAGREEFEKDIRSTGFYHTKAKHILETARIIKEKYKGEVPHTMEDVTSLPGVARKTANVVLSSAYGIIEGIAVDTHVKRLSRLLGLTDETNPDKIEKDLIQIIPKSEWFNFTYRLIEYGRAYCPSKPHKHKQCPLYNLGVDPVVEF